MKLSWLIPDDRSGGVAATAAACCEEASAQGHEATLLAVLPLTRGGRIGGCSAVSLELPEPAAEASARLLAWLATHPTDVLLLNGCEQVDDVAPYLPSSCRCVYVVHDTAGRYWRAALAHESDFEAIVAVSETVAAKFRHRLREPGKLRVIHNGGRFPEPAPDLALPRADRLLFFGGDNIHKGAGDVLRVWRALLAQGFAGSLDWLGAMNPEFRGQVEALPEAGRIEIHGRVGRDAVFPIAGRCKAILALTRAESFGLATLEAMSMGCVPVAWDIETGTKEICRAEESGLFAPVGDVRAYARQTMRACAEHGRFVEEVVRRARQDFPRERMWSGYAALFDELGRAVPRAQRSRAGEQPAPYRPRKRRFQLLPAALRQRARRLIERSPWLGSLLRDLRGV